MVNKRKKLTIDEVDRAILRNMREARRMLTGNQIAKKVSLSASAISPRLNNLKSKGIIRPMKVSGMRIFTRSFGNKQVKIKAPRSRLWGIDLKKPRKKK